MKTIIAHNFIVYIPSRIGHYQLEAKIGGGSFSVVVLMTDIKTNEKVAVKVISKEYLIEKGTVERFQREATLLSKIKSPYIARMKDLLFDDKCIYIVMEYCPNGDLSQFIQSQHQLNEDVASSIFLQIASGLKYLHDNNIAHRDLKPANILLDSNFNVKITDFGLSHETEQNTLLNSICGSPVYSAPEVIAGHPYDGKKADIWSLGVILYIMVTGKIPWEISNESQLYFQIRTARFHIPSGISSSLCHLINSLMQPQPSIRLTIEEVLYHPWVTKQPQRKRANSFQALMKANSNRTYRIHPLLPSSRNLKDNPLLTRRLLPGTQRTSIVYAGK
ncbi:CAMK family protein kinase [Histomonas meleagridis]|uniref:CAMK family protein kinase n=1 Tax=Histomonas meleagridis TaxID=135588 RepID=UPI00355A62F0|nr:CAMK family protein kinase [Histomonas meleagridis]KAH0799235.1 CAMK family protein kinase [Histomonas meleagridis]